MADSQRETFILLMSCPDQKGLVARVARFLYEAGANILHADHHVDPEANIFFMRIEWEAEGFQLSRDDLKSTFGQLVAPLGMEWSFHYSSQVQRLAIFVSRQDHCLMDLLWRYRAREIQCEIPLLISNHMEYGPVAREYGMDFRYIPITQETKQSQESLEINLLHEYRIDLVVLARYMQILSPAFIQVFPRRIINIHHSFLPAFIGGNPYRKAYERGVKLVGATSHYVTEDLDQGPIIEQDVVRVSHRDTLEDLIRKGRDLEKQVLARAVRAHLLHNVLSYANKTVVFG